MDLATDHRDDRDVALTQGTDERPPGTPSIVAFLWRGDPRANITFDPVSPLACMMPMLAWLLPYAQAPSLVRSSGRSCFAAIEHSSRQTPRDGSEISAALGDHPVRALDGWSLVWWHESATYRVIWKCSFGSAIQTDSKPVGHKLTRALPCAVDPNDGCRQSA